jgi:hypothetical protein
MAEIAEIQKGEAKLFGITNDGTAFTIAGFATFTAESAGLTHEFDLLDEKDATNHDVTSIATNARVRGDITIQPSGATRTAAAAVAVFLAPLTTVTLANFKLAALNGAWQYAGGQQIQLNFNSPAKITLPIRKWSNTTQNTSLTGAAISG